jgi:hypothetical protein
LSSVSAWPSDKFTILDKCTESAVLSSAEALVDRDEVGTGRHAASRHRAPESGQRMRSLCAGKDARFPQPPAVPVGLLSQQSARFPVLGVTQSRWSAASAGMGPPPGCCPTHFPGTARLQEWTNFSNSKASTAKVTFVKVEIKTVQLTFNKLRDF